MFRKKKRAEKSSEKMPTKGIRMPEEQWEMCQEKAKELGYHNPSEFVRDAIDFYVEWTNRESSEKFLIQKAAPAGLQGNQNFYMLLQGLYFFYVPKQ